MEALRKIENNFGKFLQLYRPFVVPEGVFDTKRLISDE